MDKNMCQCLFMMKYVNMYYPLKAFGKLFDFGKKTDLSTIAACIILTEHQGQIELSHTLWTLISNLKRLPLIERGVASSPEKPHCSVLERGRTRWRSKGRGRKQRSMRIWEENEEVGKEIRTRSLKLGMFEVRFYSPLLFSL